MKLTERDDLRKNWHSFCDCDPFDGADTFPDRMEAAGLIELLPVTDDDLEQAFAEELGIIPGGMVWHLTESGRSEMSTDLIERLREYRMLPALLGEIPAETACEELATLRFEAADALSEMRAELEQARRMYDVQIAGHRLSAKEATQNLIRATAAESALERARKALEPFARANDIDPALPDSTWLGVKYEDVFVAHCHAGDFRAAARALASQDEGEER